MDSRQSSPNKNKSCPNICLLKCKSNPSHINDSEQIARYNHKQNIEYDPSQIHTLSIGLNKPNRMNHIKMRETSKQQQQRSEVMGELKTLDPETNQWTSNKSDTNPKNADPNPKHATNPNLKDQPNQIKTTKTAKKEKPIWFKKYGKHETTFNCYMCDNTYAQKYNLYRHIRKHHSTIEKAKNAKKTHICLKCKKRFLTLNTLQRHQCKAGLPRFFLPRPRKIW